MVIAISTLLQELLRAYQKYTQKSYTEIALDFEITLSNLYRYRNGTGNPRANTIDKIVGYIQAECPEVLREVFRNLVTQWVQ